MNACMTSQKTLLSLKGEDIAYSEYVALQDITVSIIEGEKVALVGRSGAGKIHGCNLMII